METPLSRYQAAPVLWADVGGTKVAYRRFGQGAPLIFVHGWPLSGVTYRGLVEELAEEFTCYVPDLPGAGATPLAPGMTELFSDYGRLIAGFADALELEEVGFVGHDSGGTIARVAASRMPGRVRAILLTNTETPGQSVGLVRMFQIAAALPGSAAIFRALIGRAWFRQSKYGFGPCFADTRAIEGEFYDACIEPILRDMKSPLTTLRMADLEIVHRMQALHDEIDAPLLCVWGDRDPYFPLAGAKAMVEAWPAEARIEVLPGRRLFVHEESPADVAAIARPFLQQHCGRPVVAVPA